MTRKNSFRLLNQDKHTPRRMNRGFALVVTLSLMVLLTIIVVGLLSLSAASLRKSSQDNVRNLMALNSARPAASYDLLHFTVPIRTGSTMRRMRKP